ncbi:hypothetical protein [Limnoglobus roseus]|uniref:Uncharacterized protein n=1 Tax=Limnoglobus roseus TaxID=2598579 RepID=A0A5C1AME2_9BACT|nr:hypothetical protein [Limnoglobus roseus]QEL19297.1 hypothetical protein PX52LOC_06361 [Limnoglobus roseus]
MCVSKVFIPTEWDATPYGDHWAFAYTTDTDEREDYDFTVEFHESAGEEEQRSVIRLLEMAPAMLESLQELTRIIEAFTYTTQLGRTQKKRLDRAKAAIAKATGKGLAA